MRLKYSVVSSVRIVRVRYCVVSRFSIAGVKYSIESSVRIVRVKCSFLRKKKVKEKVLHKPGLKLRICTPHSLISYRFERIFLKENKSLYRWAL